MGLEQAEPRQHEAWVPRQASQQPGEGRHRVSLTATSLAWPVAAFPEAARGYWLPPGGPPSAQPGSPPSLRTGEDFGKDGGVQPDRLHPLHALRDEAEAGPAALAGGRAIRPGAGEGLPAPRAICRLAGGRHVLPRRRLAVLQHR